MQRLRKAYSVIACRSLVRINSQFIYDLTDQDQQNLENLLFYSPEVNSPSFLGAEITRQTCVSTGKTQRKRKGILLVPDRRTVYQKGRATPERSSQQLRAAEGRGNRPPLATEGAASLLCPDKRQQLLPVPPSSPPPAGREPASRSTLTLRRLGQLLRGAEPALPLPNAAASEPSACSGSRIHGVTTPA